MPAMQQSSQSDSQLLSAWLDHRHNRSFRELVDRYAGLVHMAALRQCGDRSLAADVSQLTFISLARKAKSLVSRDSIAGWLHVTAVMHTKNIIRQRNREAVRVQRYRTHMETESIRQESDHWQRMKPVLDDSLAALSAKDRETLLLRFYRSLSVAEIGASLGISNAAAQKRLTRAIERLRLQLSRRGYQKGVPLGAVLMAGLGSDAKAVVPAADVIARHAIVASAGSGGWAFPMAGSLVLGKNTMLAIGGTFTLAGLLVLVFIRGMDREPEAAGGIASSRSWPAYPVTANAGVAWNGKRDGDHKHAAVKYPELSVQHGKDRTNYSRRVADTMIHVLEDLLELGTLVSDPRFSDQIRCPGGALSAALGKLDTELKMSDEQRRWAGDLFMAHQKAQLAKGGETLERVKGDPASLMRLILAGDAFARNEIDADEYARIRGYAGKHLTGVMKIFDPRRAGGPFIADTRQFLLDMKPMLDATQLQTLEDYLEGTTTADAKAARPDDNGDMAALELEELDSTVQSLRKMMSGMRLILESVDPLCSNRQ